jgi:fructose-1,6-bisphosphatase/inositol monophosphatase family enzyme
MKTSILEQYGPFMKEMALKSGDVIRTNFQTPLDVAIKEDLTPVTKVDYYINSMVSKSVSTAYPDHGFLGEEGAGILTSNSHTWICDPLDGTRPYVDGIPLAVFSLSLIEENEVICSIIHDPFLNRTLYSAKDEGSWMDNKKMHVSNTKSLRGANIHTTWGDIESNYLSRVHNLRRLGSKLIKMDATVYAGMLTTMGNLDADIYTGDQTWDISAQLLSIKEAGGRVTNFRGEDLKPTGTIGGAVFSNGYIHDSILEVIHRKGTSTNE